MTELQMSLMRFCTIYAVLLAVLVVLDLFGMRQTRKILSVSCKMSLQLIIAGLFLEYLFEVNNPWFTFGYFCIMTGFTVHRILSQNKWVSHRFQGVIALVVTLTNFLLIAFFIVIVANQRLWNPQYVISIGGMILGNSMTANTLVLKAFYETLAGQRSRIHALLCAGAAPKGILFPFVRQALDTATVPTLNNMLGMGVVHLPGMMTGSILAGSVPFTAILYQIAIMITICIANVLSCFLVLYLGQRTFIDTDTQTIVLARRDKELGK